MTYKPNGKKKKKAKLGFVFLYLEEKMGRKLGNEAEMGTSKS